MTEISVQSLVPTSGAIPTNGYDATSLADYTAWEVGDEARFSIVVPDEYLSGNNLFINFEESTPSASKSHQWQVTTLLIRPNVNVTDEQTEVETFTQEYVSSSVADELSSRSFKVTGSAEAGYISDVEIAAGDLICFILKRISASSQEQEDSQAIKLFHVSVSIVTDQVVISDCSGRVGKIVDTIRDLFNESEAGFLSDDFIIRSLNRCQQDLAQENLWQRSTWIPVTSGASSINLLTSIASYQDIHQIQLSGMRAPMELLTGFLEYEELSTGESTPGIPEAYVVQHDTLHVWPTPNFSADSGFLVYHSYLPPDLGCNSGVTDPSIPRAHDMVFVYFVLQQAFLRDRHAPGGDAKFREYSELYEKEKQNLLGDAEPPQLSLRSYR